LFSKEKNSTISATELFGRDMKGVDGRSIFYEPIPSPSDIQPWGGGSIDAGILIQTKENRRRKLISHSFKNISKKIIWEKTSGYMGSLTN